MKKVGLIDVDGHNFPNLPLMKLSAWHKRKGDEVEWYEPFKGILEEYDITRTRDYSNHSRICSSVRSCKDSWNTYKYRRGDKRSYNGCAGRNTSYGST